MSVLPTMKAVIDKVNRAGGVCGRLLDLRVVNDSFQADTGLRSIRSFIDEEYFALPVVPSAEGLGAAILNVILNGINLIIQKNSSLWQGTIVGSVVILAVLLNVIGRRRQ